VQALAYLFDWQASFLIQLDDGGYLLRVGRTHFRPAVLPAPGACAASSPARVRSWIMSCFSVLVRNPVVTDSVALAKIIWPCGSCNSKWKPTVAISASMAGCWTWARQPSLQGQGEERSQFPERSEAEDTCCKDPVAVLRGSKRDGSEHHVEVVRRVIEHSQSPCSDCIGLIHRSE
jgi:hypothetical protein